MYDGSELTNFNENTDKWDSIADQDIPLKSHIFNERNFTLKILDQLILPHTSEYIDVKSVEVAFDVIKKMQVRGAPLIATIGMLSLLVDVRHNLDADKTSPSQFEQIIKDKSNLLISARPTAVNLVNIIRQLKPYLDAILELNDTKKIRQKLEQFVLDWQAQERHENDLLIRNSIFSLKGITKNSNKKLVIMTICNTGALATSSFGTALGVIVQLHRLGCLELALVLETRPYNQGSRLTAYELLTNDVPFRLIADSASAFALRSFQVDAVLVGADRVAKNGDTANKIGTYMLAALAKYHRIPFFVVTPASSISFETDSGEQIQIEERPAAELTTFNGCLTCPPNTRVWNPAFDITPASLITGILTERGNYRPDELASKFRLQGLMN